MKRIVYTRTDGGVSVVTPVINTHPIRENITEEQALARAWNRLPADAINPLVVEMADIPPDRTFRNAWRQDGAVIVHDMMKCREIHRAHLRMLRKPKMETLDVGYMKALESGDSAGMANIAAQKQALRDVTNDPAIEAAQTPEKLKTVMPSALL